MIQSQTVVSKEYPAFFYPVREPKGLLIFIHGGGCRRKMEIYQMDINKLLYLQGYSLLMLGFEDGLDDKLMDEGETDYYDRKLFKNATSYCAEHSKIHLKRIMDSISQAKETIGKNLPTYVLGHSYGGYLLSKLTIHNAK